MKAQQSILFGIHAIHTLLNHHPERVMQIYLLKDREDKKIQDLVNLASANQISIEYLSRQALDQMTQSAQHQGVAARTKQTASYDEADLDQLLASLSTPPFLLILDGVQDPHNLGACFRSAEAAGVHAIIVPKDKSVSITPVVSKVACGAAEIVPFVQVTNLARTLKNLQEHGIWIYGAAGEAKQSLYQTTLSGPIALVLGAEGTGLRRLTREHCDVLIHIPMHGNISSLNVSVATGVFLFEAVRQRS